MTDQFVELAGQIFRILKKTACGAWMIDYAAPKAPFFVDEEKLEQFQRIPAPGEYLLHREKGELTKAQEERMRLIAPLLEEECCITDKGVRSGLAKKAAEQYQTTARRILRLYYRYLATGILTASKSRTADRNTDYDWAIRTFYFSSKKLSLRASYEMLLVRRFTDTDGKLLDSAPSWSSFQHYFYRQGCHRKPQRVIARDGLSHYQRNGRPLYGATSDWRRHIGAYQMDATEADIYLVSRFDRSSVIGRPYIYLAVDAATQLIAGIYVGLEAGENAVMACLSNAASDKADFCSRYGIKIAPEQWPSRGIPGEIITDKGREFTGKRMEEFCRRYGCEMQSLPPFRPDRKGIVEKAFDLLQERYKPLLRGWGVIEADAQERWAVDYRSQAVLDLDDFTKIIIHCVLYLNSGRLLADGRTPAQHWIDAGGSLLQVEEQEAYCMGLRRISAELTRKGLRCNGLYYAPEETGLLEIGERCVIAFDPGNTSCVYIVLDGRYHRCLLTGRSREYSGMEIHELAAMRKKKREQQSSARRQEIESGVITTKRIGDVISGAVECAERKTALENIGKNREAERGRHESGWENP